MEKIQEKATPSIDREAFKKDLEWVAEDNEVPFGRLERYWQAESQYVHEFRYKQGGPLTLTRAFQSFYLETIEYFNLAVPALPTDTELTFYTRFVPKLLSCFHQFCSAELLATHGYPLQAFAQLRNILDHLLLIAGAMHGLSDFFKLEGYEIDTPYDMNEAKKLRLKEERAVREQMTGKKSGFSEKTLSNLNLWNDLFDLEVHGAKLSLCTAMGWIQGNEPLPVYPEYNAMTSTMFASRVCEISWMEHRLLPLLQYTAMTFPEKWSKKWQVLDHWFERMIRCLGEEQEIKIGNAIIELVTAKFPFSETTLYPLEGMTVDQCSKPRKKT